MKRALALVRVLFLAMMAVASQGAAGTGLKVCEGSARFDSSSASYEPGAEVALSFHFCGYVYGSGKYAYAAFAVVPAGDMKSGNDLQLSRQAVYGMLLREGETQASIAKTGGLAKLRVMAPGVPGEYVVVVAERAVLSTQRLIGEGAMRKSFVPDAAGRDQFLRELGTTRAGLKEVARFVVSERGVSVEAPRVYLVLNDRLPSDVQTPGGIQQKPLVFRWRIGPEFTRKGGKFLFQYRLDPDDNDWGAWTERTAVAYSYIARGPKLFQVRAKWTDDSTTLQSTDV